MRRALLRTLLAAVLVVCCTGGAGGVAGAGAAEGTGAMDGVRGADGSSAGGTAGMEGNGGARVTPGSGTATPNAPFWIDPESRAARQAAEYRLLGRTADAALMDRIATRAQAEWLVDADPRTVVEARTTAAARAGRTAVLVAYYIPGRDCGQYSRGGAGSAGAYRAWVDRFAAGLGDRSAYVIVEPDAVAHAVTGCDEVVAEERYALLAYAVERLKQQPGTRVYLDAGHSAWIPQPERLIVPLTACGIARADGFALNVSNFQTDEDSSAYGKRLSALLGGKHFVIDSSRNGNGPYTGTDEWCNPPGRALGTPPTVETGDRLIDAFLWIKRPGESDGTCRGGPEAGAWWPSYALELARNARG